VPIDARTREHPPSGLGLLRRLAWLIDGVAKVRRSTLLLLGVLTYLILQSFFARGSNPFWGYQVAQVLFVLTLLLALESIFYDEGGLAWQTHVILEATVIADVVGTSSDLYHSYQHYDKIVHFSSGAALAAAVYDILNCLTKRGVFRSTPRRRMVIAVAMSFLVAGVSWEVYEYLGDVVFHTDRVQSRLDTIHDLISNFCGAVLAASILRLRDATTPVPQSAAMNARTQS
jgi:uncharacterized membrane protein